MAGLRGSPAATRQLVMHAEEFDIHVKIWGDGDRRQMLGQLLPRHGQHFVNTRDFIFCAMENALNRRVSTTWESFISVTYRRAI